MIDARLPLIRIEQLLMDVDRLTQFSRHFTPVQGPQARPPQFYRTLIAALLSQATNLGVVSMSASVQGLTVDMLRRVLRDDIREETLTAANAAIVNRHHTLPLSAVHGPGTLSSSDAQRFGIRASSLLASYYPRYYGYYEKAIGIVIFRSSLHYPHCISALLQSSFGNVLYHYSPSMRVPPTRRSLHQQT